MHLPPFEKCGLADRANSSRRSRRLALCHTSIRANGGKHAALPTISIAEARRPPVPAGRLAGRPFPDRGTGDAGPDGGDTAFLWPTARRDAACHDVRSEGPLPEARANRARRV